MLVSMLAFIVYHPFVPSVIGLKAVRESLFNNSIPVSLIHLLACVIDELPHIQLQRLPRLQLLNKLSLTAFSPHWK